MAESKSVKEFFSNQNIFLTGGTGFVGIALIEKLLRTIPNVGTIYMLVRAKRGKEVTERAAELVKNPVFERVREEKGSDIFDKIVPIEGDVGKEGLGLSEADKISLVQNVNIVFHSAATLDFEASLESNVTTNLQGTMRVLELCHEIVNLKVLLHVSSAYVNSHMTSADEKIYPTHMSASEVIQTVKNTPDLEELKEKTPGILGEYLNSYTFTKALAEQKVAESISKFPSCIVRPSMIVAAWKEPYEGWTISKNGPQGFIMGAGKGVVRRLPMNANNVCDYIPVDIVINGMLVGAWHAATTRPSETPIFHLTSSTAHPFRWNLIVPQLDHLLHDYPLKGAVWYPYLKLIPSLTLFKISAFLFHFIPAIFLDAITLLTGGRPILLKMHRNINRSLSLLEPFIFTEWMFNNDKTMELHSKLKESDKEDFNLDLSTLDWETYFVNLGKGVRQFLHREKMSSLPAAKKKDTILFYVNLAVQTVFIGFIWLLISSMFGLEASFTVLVGIVFLYKMI